MLELSWFLCATAAFLAGFYFQMCGRAYCKAYANYMRIEANHTRCHLSCAIGECRAFMGLAYTSSTAILACGLADIFYFK